MLSLDVICSNVSVKIIHMNKEWFGCITGYSFLQMYTTKKSHSSIMIVYVRSHIETFTWAFNKSLNYVNDGGSQYL
jgi:hypothetical protein